MGRITNLKETATTGDKKIDKELSDLEKHIRKFKASSTTARAFQGALLNILSASISNTDYEGEMSTTKKFLDSFWKN